MKEVIERRILELRGKLAKASSIYDDIKGLESLLKINLMWLELVG